MAQRFTFTASEIATVAKYAHQGIYLALIIEPDGTRVLMGLSEMGNDWTSAKPSDFSARIKAFARGETRRDRKAADAVIVESPMTDADFDARLDAFLAHKPRRSRKGPAR